MLIVEDSTVKCGTAIKVLLLYFNKCLSVIIESHVFMYIYMYILFHSQSYRESETNFITSGCIDE